MPRIQFPDVPNVPGVPPLVRSAASSTAANITLGAFGGVLLNALQSQQKWGIYTTAGKQLGGVSGLSLVESLVAQSPVLSTVSVDYTKEMNVTDFPVEGGSFVSYNKVDRPGNPVVVLALSGNVSDRAAFLNAIDAACRSTNIYDVFTPEFTYKKVTIERYSLRRSAERGANLITVEISLKQIREAPTSFRQVNPIANPQSASASSQVNSGNVQPAAPGPSTLKSISNKFPSLFGNN